MMPPPPSYPTPKATPYTAGIGALLWKPPALIANLPTKNLAASPKLQKTPKKERSPPQALRATPNTKAATPSPAPVEPQTSHNLPHLYGRQYHSYWQVAPVAYTHEGLTTNPGLRALSRSGYGGVFVVHRPMRQYDWCAMEILHIPSLPPCELIRTHQKLRVLHRIRDQNLKDPRASRFVLQPLVDVPKGHSIWYSSHLYLHIVTDFCPQTFRDVLGLPNPNENEEMLGGIIWELLEGLTYLHRLGIIHANLEPENVLISQKGHCVISGFGGSFIQDQGSTKRPLSVSFSEHNFKSHHLIITPGFSAPELWNPKKGMYKFDETVDTWSLGLIICALIIPNIDRDVWTRPRADITVLQHYKLSKLTPQSISTQMWTACCPITVTEFVSMMCQLRSKSRPYLEQARDIAILNGWDKHIGAPFQGRDFTSSYVRKPEPLPKRHRRIPAEQMNNHLLKIKADFQWLRLERWDEGFIPNLDFFPFT